MSLEAELTNEPTITEEWVAQLAAQHDELTRAIRKATETTATGHAHDGLVTVTVVSPGRLTDLEIDPMLLRNGDENLIAELVLEATQDAHERLDEAVAAILPEPGFIDVPSA
jgi:DNA-binding protein YbaB